MPESVKLATPRGPTTVSAITTANLAVHRALGGDDYWVISHRPTGCRMAEFLTKRRALEVAKQLERDHAADLAALARKRFAMEARPQFHKRAEKDAANRLRVTVRAAENDQ